MIENPLFKHKKILEKHLNENLPVDDFLTEQIIKTAHTLPKKLEDQYIFLGKQIQDMPYRPEISEWIKCRYRIRKITEEGIESYCLNFTHPEFDCKLLELGYLPLCMKLECDLHKICDDDPFIY